MLLKTINNNLSFDKTSELSNSSSQCKFRRKTSRSKSFKLNRQQSQQSLQNSFPHYIKKLPKFISKNNQQQVQTQDVTPAKVNDRKNQTIENKKRTPTPSKSYRQLTDSVKTTKKINFDGINLQKQMQIHDLEKKLACQTKIRSIFEQKAKQFQNQSSNQAKKVKFVQKQLQEAKVKQVKYIQRIKQLENCLENKSIDLKTTKSNLQKLKDNIKQMRRDQLLQQIKKLKQQILQHQTAQQNQTLLINSLKNENNALKTQIQHLKLSSHKSEQQIKINALKKQIQRLKQQSNRNRSQKQIFLQQKINQIQQQVIQLKKINKQKVLEIDFLNRKKHQQIQIFRKRKTQEIKAFKMKYSILMDEYKSLKIKRNQHRTKDIRQKSKQGRQRSIQKKQVKERQTQRRHNRFVSSVKGFIEDEVIILQLSPDFK